MRSETVLTHFLSKDDSLLHTDERQQGSTTAIVLAHAVCTGVSTSTYLGDMAFFL